MEKIKRYRNAHEKLIARFLGTRKEIPRHLVVQKKLEGRYSELMGLPEVMLRPLQVLDKEDPLFGKVAYMMDQDSLGEVGL